MTSLQDRLIESMIKDLENIKNFDEGKTLRKECSLLLKRIESAKKLFIDDKILTSKLLDIEIKTKNLKG
jgi:hypothetical protein